MVEAHGRIPKASGFPVYIRWGKWVTLIGELYAEHDGELPIIILACPRCNGILSIEEEKGITFEAFFPPRRYVTSWGEVYQQTHQVSTAHQFKCSHDAVAGKGICGLTMIIKDGRAYRC
jgi:uncharacterized protein YbaR (Trm112 family)